MKNIYLLTACVLVLLALISLSIYSPIRFGKQQALRERAVKERLLKIRRAEEGYRKRHGVYTANWQSLVQGGFLADSLQFIPYSEGKRFELSADVKIGKSGRQMPVMECGANYADYLSDLDADQTAGLIEEANNSGRYPGLKIGDILTPNNNAGNWE